MRSVRMVVVATAIAGCSSSGGSSASSGSGTGPSTASGATSGLATSATTGATTTATTGGSSGTSGFAAAPHRSIPPLQDHGGARMSGLTLVTITASNDDLYPGLQSFSDALVQSQWYQTVAAPYGLAAPSASVHVVGAPAITTTLGEADVVAYIQAVIADSGSGAPAPNGNTLYLLYLPETGALDSSFGGYHEAFPSYSTSQGDSFAVVQWQAVSGPASELDVLTDTGSHEILEAATDPGRDGLLIGPGSAQPWTASVWAVSQSGHIEVGDLCEGTLTEEDYGDAGEYYQRIFSNPIALDGGDDACLPPLPGPYYSVSVPQDWYAASPGDTLQIPFTGWSTAPTSNWLTYAVEINASSNLDAGVLLIDAGTELGAGNASPCYLRQALNNGATGALTVQMPADAVPGAWGVFRIESFVEGAGQNGCYTPLSGDYDHRWLVGVYVPLNDGGGAGSPALPASPLSCDALAAAFGSDGDLYQICGYEAADGNLGLMERYSPGAQTWTAAPTLPPGPEANFAATTGPDGQIYLIDGWDGDSRYARLEAFDPETQTWQLLPSPSIARDDLAAVTGPDGRIYAIGGWSGAAVLDAVEVYDLTTGWSTLPQGLPTAVRGASVAVGSDGRLYVLGGETAVPIDGGFRFTAQDLMQIYDLDAGAWSSGPSLPTPRSFAAAVADDGGVIYLIGGYDGANIIGETDLFDPATGWNGAAPVPDPRDNLAGALGPDGKLYVIGGYQALDGNPTGALNAYSEACNCWSN